MEFKSSLTIIIPHRETELLIYNGLPDQWAKILAIFYLGLCIHRGVDDRGELGEYFPSVVTMSLILLFNIYWTLPKPLGVLSERTIVKCKLLDFSEEPVGS